MVVWTEGATFCDFSTSLQILAVLERISVVPVKALRQQQEQREQWVVAEMRAGHGRTDYHQPPCQEILVAATVEVVVSKCRGSEQAWVVIEAKKATRRTVTVGQHSGMGYDKPFPDQLTALGKIHATDSLWK